MNEPIIRLLFLPTSAHPSTWWGSLGLCKSCTNVFDPAVHQRFVSTSWLRTGAWSLHGGLVRWMKWSSLR